MVNDNRLCLLKFGCAALLAIVKEISFGLLVSLNIVQINKVLTAR